MAGSRALATRCPACGTVFRVVPDQLRVAEGWVRCGRCSEVFNAASALVDTDTGARQRPPDNKPQPQASTPAGPAEIDTGTTDSLDWGPEPLVHPAASPEQALSPTQPDLLDPGTAPERPAEPDLEPARAPFDQPFGPPFGQPGELPNEQLIEQPFGQPGVETGLESTPTRVDPAGTAPDGFGAEALPERAAETATLTDPRAEPDDRPPPSFVQRAERAARWRRPQVRLALGAGAGLAALALAAQVVFTYRDLAAARWPALQPVLAQACAAMGCNIGPPRLIAALAVQSSGLSRVEASPLYGLVVTLRNQADIDAALPAIDLSLTDTQGRLVSRRALSLAELGHGSASLPAGRELVLQATLQVNSPDAAEPVAGYTIELFYP